MTTLEILFGAILYESGEIFGIAFLRFGIEIELFSLEKLENDTNFSKRYEFYETNYLTKRILCSTFNIKDLISKYISSS